MTDTPIYDEVLAETRVDHWPTFEPVISHQDFLKRHDFTDWLYETSLRVHWPVETVGPRERRRRRKAQQ